jgi:hypothetical protein
MLRPHRGRPRLGALGFQCAVYEQDHVPVGRADDPRQWAKRLWSRRDHPDGEVKASDEPQMPGRRSLQLPAAPPQPRHTSGRLSNGVRETESGSEQILLDVDREVSVRCVIKFVALGDRKGQTEEIVLGEPAEKGQRSRELPRYLAVRRARDGTLRSQPAPPSDRRSGHEPAWALSASAQRCPAAPASYRDPHGGFL